MGKIVRTHIAVTASAKPKHLDPIIQIAPNSRTKYFRSVQDVEEQPVEANADARPERGVHIQEGASPAASAESHPHVAGRSNAQAHLARAGGVPHPEPDPGYPDSVGIRVSQDGDGGAGDVRQGF